VSGTPACAAARAGNNAPAADAPPGGCQTRGAEKPPPTQECL
jgi:hypothetical protein